MLIKAMAKKKLRSGLQLDGIAPNLLLKQVEVTAPFLFQGELNTDTVETYYLKKLRLYKKNLKSLANIDLTEYFYICMAAHWATAGTFVPTDVDNQIRKKLWNHSSIKKHIHKMTRLTIESWKWDYQQVTNRKSYNRTNNQVISTHEGTWLSVAIGAYCALVKNKELILQREIEDIILSEIKKEESLLIQLREDRDHINFLRAAPLMAHNFGDLDRVMIQWDMNNDDKFCQKIYKLGHQLNKEYSPILVYTGKVNKQFSSKENHRHMSMRRPKCLRKSHKFLIPVGPFMDQWGQDLGASSLLSIEEKAEVVGALYEGFKRQDQALGYGRALAGILSTFQDGIYQLEAFMAFDLFQEIIQSKFLTLSIVPEEDFKHKYISELNDFICPITKFKF
jgi:hypothetical protein